MERGKFTGGFVERTHDENRERNGKERALEKRGRQRKDGEEGDGENRDGRILMERVMEEISLFSSYYFLSTLSFSHTYV